MPLDPQAAAVIEAVEALGLPPVNEVSPDEARANFEARPRAAGPDVGNVEDRTVPGPAGEIPVRVFTPEGAGPFPILMWYHGGGWVIGNVRTHDAICRHLCVQAGCVVVSVDYRLAPEHKYPAAADDCYAATAWAAANAASLNGDASRLAVGGDSAGGNLSAVVSLMARDKGGPHLVHQLMVYPVTEYRVDTSSYIENADGYLLTRDGMVWFWGHYLGNEGDGAEAYASPMRASDLSSLPQALVITAEFDPLRDEGEEYARRLTQAGVPTACTRYDGMVHGFFGMPDLMDKGRQAIAEASAALREAFAGN